MIAVNPDSGFTFSLRNQVEHLFSMNLRTGRDRFTGFRYANTCPSPLANPAQSFWHSCFSSIAAAHFSPDHAIKELATLLARQDADGFIGHKTTWHARKVSLPDAWSSIQSRDPIAPRHSALIHPPILSQAVERISEITKDKSLPLAFMEPLDRYHNWIGSNRVDSDGLVVSISPEETANTHSPAFDFELGLSQNNPSGWALNSKRYLVDLRNAMSGYDQRQLMVKSAFRAKDVLTNALFIDSLETMSRLHGSFGADNVAQAYAEQAKRITESMIAHLYSREGGAFFATTGQSDRRTTALTVAGLSPLIISGLPLEIAEGLVDRNLSDGTRFWVRYPLSTVAASDPAFDPRNHKLTWRGPTSLEANWIIWRGLKRHGFEDLAESLALRSSELIRKSGMRAFYNPLNGEGLGLESYSGAAIALDMYDS
ncbi:MAG: alpha,alpha-trehalase [Gammaproteobacteria bacterium]|nr:alpha,alpha-trehalase [Gammaproteobacteria bacterium]